MIIDPNNTNLVDFIFSIFVDYLQIFFEKIHIILLLFLVIYVTRYFYKKFTFQK